MEISWWTIALQTVNFVVLVWLLQRFLYMPVQKIIETRRQADARGLADAEQAKAGAEAEKQRYEAKLATIEADRLQVLADAHASVEQERQRLLDIARQDATKFLHEARTAATKERAETLQAMRADVADLSVVMAKTVLKDLARALPQDVFLANVQTAFDSLTDDARKRFKDEAASNDTGLAVITANLLNPAEQQAWRARISAMVEEEANIHFEQDPELIAGAVLRLPNTALRATWADKLSQARQSLMKDVDGTVS